MKNNVFWLNPLFRLLERRRLIWFAVILAAEVLLLWGSDTFWEIFFVILPMLFYIFYGTNRISFERGVVKFNYYHTVRRAGKNRPVLVKYTVSDIEDLKFDQNKLEKIFGCGHFSFRGNSVYESRYNDFQPKTSFTFYGLTNFRQTKKEICDILGVNEAE
jgi:hypothetical protein